MADDNNEQEYKVGYGKPPRITRFRKGQSGNPAGRPRGRKNLATIVNKVFFERVKVKDENGRSYYMPKMEAALTQLLNRAAQGDERSARTCALFLRMFPSAMEPLPLRSPKFWISFVDVKDGQLVPEDPNAMRIEMPLDDWVRRGKTGERDLP